ncbi:MAG: cyclopropane-fatty-acyl-phospholipid synthase family protein [Gammaproteobacteria bacterium]
MYIKSLKGRIRHGGVNVHLPNGEIHTLGDDRPRIDWYIHRARTLGRILRNPELALGETYVDGGWDVGEGQLPAFIGLLMRNVPQPNPGGLRRAARSLLHLLRTWNPIRRSYRNVALHYDLDEWLFRQFLDQDMQYSCAYFTEPDISLEEAQRAKCRHILHKLRLHPEHRVLDIGCGWGGLALYLAERTGAQVTGLTLSKEQLRIAQRRARERGLEGKVRFVLQDYRQHEGKYDRIVSVGMFEHVGPAQHRRYFDQVRDLLAEDGIAVVHTIGRQQRNSTTNPWIRRYIFPGGSVPALSEISQALESSALITTDVEVLRLHYAYTLAAWQRRFRKARARIAERLGERFCRLWEFYLAGSENAFRWRDLVVFQIQVAKQHASVPVTRSYLYAPREPAVTANTAEPPDYSALGNPTRRPDR